MPNAQNPRVEAGMVLDDPSGEAGARFIERYLQVSRRLESAGLRIWDIRMRPQLRIPRHEHAWAFFCAVIGGSLDNSNAPAFRKDAWVFHPESHGHESAIGPEGAHILTVEMSRGWLDRVLEDDHRVPGSARTVGHAAPLIRSVLRELRGGLPCSGLALEGLALELAVAAVRASELRETQDVWTRRAVDLVRTRFAETLTLDDISREIGVGPRRLAAWFRRRFGVTVGEFQRRLRVEFVLRRLDSRDRLVDIAADAGFADQAHCTRVFKRITGTTPGAYRLTGRKGRPDARDERPPAPARRNGTSAAGAGTGRSRRDSRFR